jgi:hypothetical protein
VKTRFDLIINMNTAIVPRPYHSKIHRSLHGKDRTRNPGLGRLTLGWPTGLTVSLNSGIAGLRSHSVARYLRAMVSRATDVNRYRAPAWVKHHSHANAKGRSYYGTRASVNRFIFC